MKKKKHVQAIFDVNENVPDFLTDAQAFFKVLLTPAAAAYVTIPATNLTTAQTHGTNALTAETAVRTGTHGTADARDIAVGLTLNDVRNFVAIVQTAANNAVDEETAIAIVTTCGLRTHKKATKSKADFNVENDLTSAGSLILSFKAAPKGTNAAYEIQESSDNINFITVKVTPDSRSKFQHGKTPGTKIYYRGRIILSDKKGGTQDWMSLAPTIIR